MKHILQSFEDSIYWAIKGLIDAYYTCMFVFVISYVASWGWHLGGQ